MRACVRIDVGQVLSLDFAVLSLYSTPRLILNVLAAVTNTTRRGCHMHVCVCVRVCVCVFVYVHSPFRSLFTSSYTLFFFGGGGGTIVS